MPTLVRSVRKVVLFVLVMAVSGVGVAQAQTDPTVASSSHGAADSSSCLSSAGDAAMANRHAVGGITPEVARQSARLYATAEQVRPAAVTGGAEFMFSVDVSISDGWIMHYTVWEFYKINGDETNFFVDTASTAYGRRVSVDEEYLVTAFGTLFYVPLSTSAAPSTARLVTRVPDSAVRLPDGGEDIIFSLEHDGASISRRIPASPYTLLNSTTMPDSNNRSFYHSTTVTYLRDPIADPDDPVDATHPGVFTGGSVAHWNCGPPWGMKVAVWGEAVSSLTRVEHRWEKVGEELR